MKGRFAVVTLLVLLVGGAVGAWIFSNMERGTRTIQVGYQGEARFNDFLAAQRMLEKRGSKVQSLWRSPTEAQLQELDALVLPRRRRQLSPGQVQALVAFVERGGKIVAEGSWVSPGEEVANQDPLFEAFGVRKVWSAGRDEPDHGGENKAPQDPPKPPLLKVFVDQVPYDLEYDTHTLLEARGEEPAASIDDDHGDRLLVFRRGEGEAVGEAILLNSLDFLNNWSIGKADHGPFLAKLLEGRARVAIQVEEDAPSLLAWLKAHAALPLLILGLLIVLALWSGLPRFGPLMAEPSEHRRSLLEHLAACGRFQWRHRDGKSLLRASREATLARLQRVHPAWAALPPDQMCQRLAVFAGLPEPQVFQAIRYEAQTDARSFLLALQTLDLIRKKL